MTGLIHFSPDAASNDVAAPPILFVEGQPAKTVNNSMREVMAALAKWRDDNAGGLVATRGTGDVYGLATGQVLDGATIGLPHTLAFTVSAENQGPASLAPDGLSAAPIRRPDNLEMGPRDLRPGIVYRVARIDSFYLLTSPSFDDCGKVDSFGTVAPPAGWLPCDGRAVSRSAYAALFSRIGAAFGAGDGSTTFNIPDASGRALFGVDGGKNRLTAAGGLIGTLGAAGGTEAVTLTEAQLASHSHGGTAAAAGGHDHGGSTGGSGGHDHGGSTGGGGSHTHGGNTGGGGGHSHSGSTNSAGTHAHGIGYVRQTNYATNGASGGMNALNAGDGGTNTTGITDGNGAHSHGVSIDAVADHTHGFTTGAAGDHAHTIAAAGNHAHGIPSVADHAHALTISATGSSQGHSNIPPGLVVTFAIKV